MKKGDHVFIPRGTPVQDVSFKRIDLERDHVITVAWADEPQSDKEAVLWKLGLDEARHRFYWEEDGERFTCDQDQIGVKVISELEYLSRVEEGLDTPIRISTPELNKLKELMDVHGALLLWMMDHYDISAQDREEVLVGYAGLDEGKIKQERRALLNELTRMSQEMGEY